MDEKTQRLGIWRSIKSVFLLKREVNTERRSPQPPPPPPPPYPLRGGVSPLPPVIRSVNGKVPFPPPPPPLQRARNVSPPPPLPPPRNVIGCQCPPDHYLFKRCRLSETNSSNTQEQLCSNQNTDNIKKLKPLHWEKIKYLNRNSFWGEIQKSYEALKVPEIDRSELESLFPASDPEPKLKSQIEPIRAINCEIILSKVKIPLNELMDHVLALDDSVMDADQVDLLIKHFPTDWEMELLKGCKRGNDKLGRCEQFFLELTKVPRAKSKLEVFAYKLRFNAQVSEFRECLNIMTSLKEQIRSSTKFKIVMQTILSLGNALNQGTPRGRASGFKLVSLLKLTEMHSTKRNLTLMHFLCKVLADKQPDVLDFSKDLGSLEPVSRLHLDIDCHFTREKIQEGFLQTAFIPTSQQLADVMTKALNHVQHSLLVDKLGITDHPT